MVKEVQHFVTFDIKTEQHILTCWNATVSHKILEFVSKYLFSNTDFIERQQQKNSSNYTTNTDKGKLSLS